MGARALTALALLAACAGPRPAVERVSAEASPRPGCTRVSVELVNRGGAGEIELDITLRDERTGARLRADRTVEVGRDQRLLYTTDVETPPGAYVAQVDASYPH